jgi:hypothetical protein
LTAMRRVRCAIRSSRIYSFEGRGSPNDPQIESHTEQISLLPPQQPRFFRSFDEAAAETAISRLYGGIHFEFDNEDGLASGACIGRMISERVKFTDRRK